MEKEQRAPFYAKFLSTTCGSGFFPVAPGTIGSAIAIIVLWIVPALSWRTLAGCSVILYFLGVDIATKAEKEWGHDAGRINLDEVVGMMISVVGLPKTWIVYLAAFLIFRIMDVWKPNPANASQKLPGGWGVMTDDVVAGIYTNILIQIGVQIVLHVH